MGKPLNAPASGRGRGKGRGAKGRGRGRGQRNGSTPATDFELPSVHMPAVVAESEQPAELVSDGAADSGIAEEIGEGQQGRDVKQRCQA